MARRRRQIEQHQKQARERKYRLRGGKGRTTRFIPDADSAFARMARLFADHVERHADRFGIAPEQVEELVTAVAAFRDALSKTLTYDSAGPSATRIKNDRRKEAERIIRSIARYLRGTAEDSLTDVDRMNLNMPTKQRSKRRARRLECPQIAPILKFIGTTDPHKSSAHGGRHILEYRNDFDRASTAKPHGAARLELFVELVPMDEPIPTHPGQRSGGRLWYLRSFTTSRFEVDYPRMFDDAGEPVPALVVYWGRWADATGGVGPFSRTCVAQVERDFHHHRLPGSGHAHAPQVLPDGLGEQVCVMRLTQVRGHIEARPKPEVADVIEPLALPGG